MRAPRLMAANRAGVEWPAGMAVLGAAHDADLPPVSDLRIVSDDAVMHARHPATRACPDAPAALVYLPRSKALARHLIAVAAQHADRIIVDGFKTDGVDALFREIKAHLGDVPSVTKAHGRLFWFDRPAPSALAEWRDPGPRPGPSGLMVQAGVFSADAIDPASQLLIDALPPLRGAVADLGAGWGALSHAAWRAGDISALHLVDADARALDCAALNLADAPVHLHWADATQWTSPVPLDAVIMNPPFHQGRQGDPALGRAFIEAAARSLKPAGTLWMVANRHLPYEECLSARFAQLRDLPGTGRFKLIQAARPRR